MKNKAIPKICAFVLGLALITPAGTLASDDPAMMAVDTVLVRPVCLAATAVGSVFFVLSLPWAVPSKNVHRAAASLVGKPAHATFKRRLGDMDSLMDYYN
jgi:hypothetical protein